MENDLDDVRTEDLPDDLTPFITQTSVYPVSGGGFGDVWKCNYNHDANGISAFVAVKAFKLPEHCDLETINRKINREIGILKILRHNNIVPLWGIATGFGRMPGLRCLVSPWMPNGTLNVYLTSHHNVLTALDRSRMLEDVSAGLRYLHSVPVMHGDVTGANILIDKRGHAKLIDFGLSTVIQPFIGQSHLVATSIRPGAIRYAAPELFLLDNARELPVPLERADIYSFGCIMLQVLSGRCPWSEIRGEPSIIIKVSQGRGPQRPDGYPAIIDSDWNFIQECLQFKPELRPSADKVLDFVMQRSHSLDSCSRPPGNPPDHALDDLPGTSLHDSSNDSDKAEQPPDSPPLHPDYELETLTADMDKLSAATISAPVYSVPPFSFNYSSGEFPGSSTAPAPGNHSLDEMFQCRGGDSIHTLPTFCALQISGIYVDSSNSEKNVELAEARINQLLRPIAHKAGKTMRQTFSPPIKLSLGDTFSLHLRYRKRFRKIGHEDIHFDLADILHTSDAKQEYHKSHDGIQIVVVLSGKTTTEHAEQSVSTSDTSLKLQPTSSEVIQIRPRFRILVIGKTGVGKSSLVRHIFGVDRTIVCYDKPGEADIDHEFISPQNDRLVLHDSKSFEPGEEDNLNKVRDFIERRRKMPDLKDQLHAIWLCFDIPRAGGRLLETGTEDFLTLKRGGKLGNIPVVVVFTKYDRFINRVNRTLDESSLVGLSSSAVKEFIKNKADAELKEICIGPLEKFAGLDVPYATVSTKEEHAETLARLIQITEDCVCKYVGIEALVMTSVAQQFNIGFRIKASIEVGKRGFWKALASYAAFQDRVGWDSLHVLHTEIVAVWNFHDPHRYLCSPEFSRLMVAIVDKLDVGPTSKTMAVIAKYLYPLYGAAFQRFTAYIVDLTFVLQTLCLVLDGKELSRRAIKLAVISYYNSPMSGEVHNRIREYDMTLTLRERRDRDTLDKIMELVGLYRIDEEKISAIRAQIPTVGLVPAEPR